MRRTRENAIPFPGDLRSWIGAACNTLDYYKLNSFSRFNPGQLNAADSIPVLKSEHKMSFSSKIFIKFRNEFPGTKSMLFSSRTTTVWW